MTNELAAPSTDDRQLATAPPLGFLANAVATFEGIDRVAKLMAAMGTMPEHLQGKPADCFRIVVQAAKWGMDPFAVAECTSLVHGRLCWEGKLVAAALRAMNAIEGRLVYETTGKGQDASIVVTGKPRGGELCSVSGSVADWRTHTKDKAGNQIKNAWDKDPMSMLVYRGTRQWARLYAPEALLGVYTPDEVDDVRTVEATVVSSVPEPKPAKDRVAEAVAPTATGAAEQQTITGAAPTTPAAPTLKDLNEAAIAFSGAHKQRAIDALKQINVDMGLAKIAACPTEKIADCLARVRAAHEKLNAEAAAPQAGAK